VLRFGLFWLDSVVPLWVEYVASDVDASHLFVGDLDALFVGLGIEGTFYLEAGCGCCCADQFDVTEEPVLDLVPFRCALWIMMDVDREAGLIGELVQLQLPQPHTRAIGAAAIGGDGHLAHVGIPPASHAIEPGADRCNSEGGRIGGNADADPALISTDVIDAIGERLAEGLVFEVMYLDAPRVSLGAKSLPPFL